MSPASVVPPVPLAAPLTPPASRAYHDSPWPRRPPGDRRIGAPGLCSDTRLQLRHRPTAPPISTHHRPRSPCPALPCSRLSGCSREPGRYIRPSACPPRDLVVLRLRSFPARAPSYLRPPLTGSLPRTPQHHSTHLGSSAPPPDKGKGKGKGKPHERDPHHDSHRWPLAAHREDHPGRHARGDDPRRGVARGAPFSFPPRRLSLTEPTLSPPPSSSASVRFCGPSRAPSRRANRHAPRALGPRLAVRPPASASDTPIGTRADARQPRDLLSQLHRARVPHRHRRECLPFSRRCSSCRMRLHACVFRRRAVWVAFLDAIAPARVGAAAPFPRCDDGGGLLRVELSSGSGGRSLMSDDQCGKVARPPVFFAEVEGRSRHRKMLHPPRYLWTDAVFVSSYS